MEQANSARQLAELEVKRNRTLADLDTIQQARKSTQLSLDGFSDIHNSPIQTHLNALTNDTMSDKERIPRYFSLDAAYKAAIGEFTDLVNEWHNLQVQEGILVRMLVEIDRQIDEIKKSLK